MIPWNSLMTAAREAAQRAYIPYSHFPVGAALLDADGQIWTGCNIENASYGLTNCAERTAMFKAVSEGKRSFRALVICGGTDVAPAVPCGACLQVLAEFCPPDLPVRVIPLREGNGVTRTLGDYLPYSFALSAGT